MILEIKNLEPLEILETQIFNLPFKEIKAIQNKTKKEVSKLKEKQETEMMVIEYQGLNNTLIPKSGSIAIDNILNAVNNQFLTLENIANPVYSIDFQIFKIYISSLIEYLPAWSVNAFLENEIASIRKENIGINLSEYVYSNPAISQYILLILSGIIFSHFEEPFASEKLSGFSETINISGIDIPIYYQAINNGEETIYYLNGIIKLKVAPDVLIEYFQYLQNELAQRESQNKNDDLSQNNDNKLTIKSKATRPKNISQKSTEIELTADKKRKEAFLTVSETAKLLKVSIQTIHNWKQANTLPFHRIGRRIYFKEKEVIESMKKAKYREI